MSDDESPGEQFLSELGPSELARRAEQRFEGAVVEKIVQQYDIAQKMKFDLRDKVKRDGTGPFLTFDAFWELFQGFPLYLFFARIPKVQMDMTVQRLFDQFESRKAYNQLQEASADSPVDRGYVPIGLVFFWPHLKDKGYKTKEGGALVLHNWQIAVEVPGTQVTWHRPEGGTWHIDTLGRVLDQCRRNGVFSY